MKNTTIALAAALLAGTALAGPAAADFSVFATIDKTKVVTVTEDINIRKDIRLVDIDVDLGIDSAADALAIVNQSITGNTYSQGFDTDVDHDARMEASVGGSADGSFGNQGITAVNQDAGALSNQANAGAFALTNEADAFVNAEASVEQILGSHDLDFLNTLGGSYRSDASITDSIQGNIGITHVNQNSGVINTQANVVAVAVGLGGDDVFGEAESFAMAEADLGQETVGVTVTEGFDFNTATMARSVRFNTGVVGVNQAAGNGALQANLVALSAAMIGQ